MCPIIIKFDKEWKASIGFGIGGSLVTLAKASLVKWWKQKANCSVFIERER